MIKTLNDIPLQDHLVLLGMSGIGKSTFAQSLKTQDYQHICFDSKFPWATGRLTDVTKDNRLRNIIQQACKIDKFVLDGWILEDKEGEILYEGCPDACLIVLFDHYDNILKRCLKPTTSAYAYHMLYKKFYNNMHYDFYKRIRFLKVIGETGYVEYTLAMFKKFI